jgi:hypothetical protein
MNPGEAMEFGIFHEFLSAGSGSQTEAFAQSFQQVEAAERWGSTPSGWPRST